MKNNIFIVMKKEFSRFFKDKRMVLTALVLPGVMIYLIYSFMGEAITNMTTVDNEYIPIVKVINLPNSVEKLSESTNINFQTILSENYEVTKDEVSAKETDLFMVFPENFDEMVANYSPISGEYAPNIEIYYNSTSLRSNNTYTSILALLDTYESILSNKFDINRDIDKADISSEKDSTGFVFSAMMPMLLITFLFSGCMAIAPESIAGEKERGTIATLLVTQIKRSELAIGKILSLCFIALLCGMSSSLGMLLSLPKLMGSDGENFRVDFYSVIDYLSLFFIVISTILIIITLISIISAFAKTVKEATTTAMPLMIVVIFIGLAAMFETNPSQNWYYYLIPIYNNVQCISNIFSFEYSVSNIIITVVTNLIITGFGGYLLTKMFSSEKLMFSK